MTKSGGKHIDLALASVPVQMFSEIYPRRSDRERKTMHIRPSNITIGIIDIQ